MTVFKGKDHAFDPTSQPVLSQQGGRFTFITVNDDILLFPEPNSISEV